MASRDTGEMYAMPSDTHDYNVQFQHLWDCTTSSRLEEVVAASDLPIAQNRTLDNFVKWARAYAAGRYTQFDFTVQSVHLYRDRRPP